VSDDKDKFDNAAKIVFVERPGDVVQFATGYTSPTIELLRTSLEVRKKREVDTLAKIKIPSEKNPKRLITAIAHVEFQTEPLAIMPYRMGEYIGRLLRVYQKPVISTVIYLRQRDVRKKDTGIFEQKYPKRFLAEYNVIRLWEIDGQEALDNCTAGSLPFTPLMEPPEDYSREKWLEECVQVADDIIPPEHKPNLFFSMSVLSGLVISDTNTLETIIPEDIMKESAYYQYLRSKAIAEGKAEGLAEGEAKGLAEGETKGKLEGLTTALLSLVNTRFTSIPKTISRKISSIRDEEVLLDIQKLAIDANTKREFIKAIRAQNI